MGIVYIAIVQKKTELRLYNPIRFAWKPLSKYPLTLVANIHYEHGAITPTGLREEHLDPVQQWCEANNCGCRVSFDMFEFKTEKEMITFLLRWS